jgi:hypothetical protein
MEPAWLSEVVVIATLGAGLAGLWLRLRALVRLDQMRQQARAELLRSLPSGSRLSEHGADGSLVRIDVGPADSREERT